MDVNGTRYHLLLGERDWREVVAQTAIDADHAEWLSSANPRAIEFDAEFGGISLVRQVPLLTQPGDTSALEGIGASAADVFRNVFWLDAAGKVVRVQPEGTRRTGDFWRVDALPAELPAPRPGSFAPLAPPLPADSATILSGLAVTNRHYAVTGTHFPGGLVIFDLDSSGPPCRWRWPEALDFRPLLIAPTPDGGVVVVDHHPETTSTRLWRLDRQFTPVDLGARIELAAERTQDFSPLNGEPRVTPAVTFGGAAALGPGAPVDVVSPLAVAVLPDHSVLLLDARLPGEAARLILLVDGQLAASVTLDELVTSPQLDGDLTHVAAFAVTIDSSTPDEIRGRCHVATNLYAQVFELAFVTRAGSLDVALNARALPLPGGRATAPQPPRLVATSQDVRFFNDGRWFALAEQPRYRYLPSATLAQDSSLADNALRFDGKQPGCVWHRLMLDACIPAGCAVRIRARAADEIDRLELADWLDQPAPYRRGDGSELPFERPFGELDLRDPANAHLGTFETLLSGAVGQYLQLEITLLGDGRASPKIRAMRVYYPRFSYLYKYLPAVYREDRAAADFIDRWMANPEGLLTSIEGRIAHSEIIFDAATAPPEYLDWLGGWFDALLDPSWSESRRRLFLKYAWLLYRWRGSPLGLMAFLRLATDQCPDESLFDALLEGRHAETATFGGYGIRLVENFELTQVPAMLLGDPTTAAPSLSAEGATWQPADGGARLHELFRQFLQQRHAPGAPDQLLANLNADWQPATPLTDVAELTFSPVPPANAGEQADWRDFGRQVFLSGYPDIAARDVATWREFLARRYGTIGALNTAHGRTGSAAWSAFSAVPLPGEHALPADGRPLEDWLQFALRALPMKRNAHRFTVLVPAHPGETTEARAQRLARVATIVEAEKPAHTSFDAKLFWALFQAGAARVGMDTVVGESSRFLPLVLDAGYLRDGYLPEAHPWTQTDRQVIGRVSKRNVTWTSTNAAPAPVH